MKAYKAPSGNQTWRQKSFSYSSMNFPATNFHVFSGLSQLQTSSCSRFSHTSNHIVLYHRNIRLYRIFPLKSTFSSRIAQFRFEDLVEGAFHSCPSLVFCATDGRREDSKQREFYGKIRENPTNTNLIGG